MKKLLLGFVLSASLISTSVFADAVKIDDVLVARNMGKKEGCFVLYNMTEQKYEVEYNKALCTKEEAPSASFDYATTIIGIDLGVIDENTKYEWDGERKLAKEWEHDHTLPTAIQSSVVWYFQKVAEKIGKDNYKKYLDKFEYGNKDVSGDINKFWLGSKATLKISAEEQVKFLNKLYSGKLDIKATTLDKTKKLFFLEARAGNEVSGKPGTGDNGTGWFIGHIKSGGKEYAFATFISNEGKLFGMARVGLMAKAITFSILKDAGLY